MISLTDLRARQVVPAWQEAVAVVQELLYAVTQTQGANAQLPDVDHIALIANGDVVELPGSGPTGNPVSYAAGLLKTMLDGAAVPPELRTLVDENAVEKPRITTIAEFTRQLAFFERPGRRHDVEQLVARAMSADAQSRAEEELRRLKEKTLVGGAELDVFRTEVPEKKRIAPGRQVVAVAAVLAVVLVAAGAWWLYGWMQRPGSEAVEEETVAEVVTPPAADAEPAPVADASGDSQHAGAVNGAPQPAAGASPAATTSTAGETPQEQQASFFERTRASIRRAVDSAFGAAETAAPEKPPAVEPETPKEAAAPAPRRRRPAPASSRSAGTAASSTAAPPAAAAQPPQVSTTVEEQAIEPPPQSVGGVSEPQSLVYSRADADVRPAILLRPVLPAEPPPDVPPDQIGTLELIVDEYGDVEQVRLISPSNRFHERMLVAHAKSWKFRPAIRDGRPVKYKTVVRLTI